MKKSLILNDNAYLKNPLKVYYSRTPPPPPPPQLIRKTKKWGHGEEFERKGKFYYINYPLNREQGPGKREAIFA